MKDLDRKNIYTDRTMKSISTAFLAVYLFASDSRANVVEDWHKIGESYLNENAAGFDSLRGMAMLHVAEFDAVNAVFGGYAPYALRGSLKSTNRTAAESLSAQSRDEGLEYLTDIIAQHPLPLLQTARMFALLYMAKADAVTSVFEAKYVYNFWRPISAIRAGANDGNEATPADAAWTPFRETHSHPDYPSALCQDTAAAIEVLINVYGDDFSLSTTWPGSRQPRVFQRLSDITQDAVEARVSAGIHFRNSCNVAVNAGQRIAQNALQNFLRPVPNLISGSQLKAGQFQLNLTTGRVFQYVIESSNDLSVWQPWQTNLYGVLLNTDSIPATDRRFYRTVLLKE
jgi:hypothetical protein